MVFPWNYCLFIFILSSCYKGAKEDSPLIDTLPLSMPDTTTVPEEKPVAITYQIKPSVFLDSIQDEHQIESILALNRVNRRNLHRYDSLLVPDVLSEDFQLYAPFPARLDLPDSLSRLILVSIRLQAFAAYDSSGRLRWGPVSTGKASTPTPVGFLHTNWKSKSTISTENPEWILNWYFNIDNFRGVSFHEYDLPGFPASHACIRMRGEDAKWLYFWARQWKLTGEGTISENGTPVIIYGKYDFRRKQPWHSSENYQHEIQVDRHELDSVLRIYRRLR